MTETTEALTRASIFTRSATNHFISVALFSGVGLLLSLAVLILDQYATAVEWF
jgi:hypothetical protein